MIQYVNALLASEDPTVTHHWLLPETAEIIYGGLASVIVVGALIKFAGPATRRALALAPRKSRRNSMTQQPQRSMPIRMRRIFVQHLAISQASVHACWLKPTRRQQQC